MSVNTRPLILPSHLCCCYPGNLKALLTYSIEEEDWLLTEDLPFIGAVISKMDSDAAFLHLLHIFFILEPASCQCDTRISEIGKWLTEHT